jgi:P4 family phage/plasmid primase-like protien
MSDRVFDPLSASDAPDLLAFESETEPTEACLVNLLEVKIGPALTVGGQWFLYRDGCWRKTDKAELRPLAQSVIPAKWRTARREHAIMDHLEGRLQKPREALASFHRWDGDAVLLNVSNGILRVTAKEVELLPYDSTHLFTTQIAAEYDSAAEAPLFERAVSEAIEDCEDSDLLMLCVANFLLPDARFESCLVCHGDAGSGKSTIAEGITAALGSDLVRQLGMAQICDPKGYHVPKLQGAAVNIGTELDSLEVSESSNFKAIVSGEAIEARAIYGEPFTMRTTCKLCFLSNHLPRFRHGTDAELRRVRFVRFSKIPEKKDVTLKDRIKAERNGIFGLMVRFLQRLLTLSALPLGSAKSQESHQRFGITNDTVGAFVKRHCILDRTATTAKQELSDAYADFIARHGLPDALGSLFFKHLYDRLPQLKEMRPRIAGGRQHVVAGIKITNGDRM